MIPKGSLQLFIYYVTSMLDTEEFLIYMMFQKLAVLSSSSDSKVLTIC